MNNDKVLFGSLGLYRSFVTGILNSVKEILSFVLCSEEINYAEYIKNVSQEKNALSSCLQNTMLSWLQATIFS
jgi:hypothetical protein